MQSSLDLAERILQETHGSKERDLHAERRCMVDGIVLDLHLNFGSTDVPVVDCGYGR